MIELLLLLIGLLGLWGGTELVIKGALNIADYYKLSQMFVGMTILAIGTDLPEMFVAVDAAIHKQIAQVDTSGLIVGNALGSSFSQITLILGIAGLFGTLTYLRKSLYADGLMILFSIVLVFTLGFDGTITRKEGLVMVLVYMIYYTRLFQQEKVISKVNTTRFSGKLWWNVVLLVIGLFIVAFASKLVVENGVKLAIALNMKQSLVGILFIGLGTSLPELALSINAAVKKANNLSVGNLIGSNIFDLLMPIGLGASIAGLEFNRHLIFIDLPILLFASFTALLFFHQKKGLQRNEGIMLIGIFLIYAILKLAGI